MGDRHINFEDPMLSDHNIWKTRYHHLKRPVPEVELWDNQSEDYHQHFKLQKKKLIES
jgi:hypothetical protein